MTVSEHILAVSELNMHVSELNMPVSEQNMAVSELNMRVSELNTAGSKLNSRVNSLKINDYQGATARFRENCRGRGLAGYARRVTSQSPGSSGSNQRLGGPTFARGFGGQAGRSTSD